MANTKIVWIEDDQDVLTAFEPLFQEQGWEVISASSAEQGITSVRQVKPDLIIMDIIMAQEHGYTAIKNLKNEPELSNVPIVIFSGVTHRWMPCLVRPTRL